MKIVALRNIDHNRVFKNREVLRRFLKLHGFYYSGFTYCFSGYIMTSKTTAIKIEWYDFNNGTNGRNIRQLRYNISKKEFTHI
jgi:hypothetical protein